MASPEHTALVQRLFVQNILAVRGFVYSLLPNYSRTDDVVQETFLTVTAKAGDYIEGTNFRSWACSIARFKVLEALKHAEARTVALDVEVIESLCAMESMEWQPEMELRALEQCMEQLAPQARRVIDLRYENAHSPLEIAQLMGWTVNSVNVALARTRSKLRECVGRRLRTLVVDC